MQIGDKVCCRICGLGIYEYEGDGPTTIVCSSCEEYVASSEMPAGPQRVIARLLGLRYIENRVYGWNEVISNRLADKLWNRDFKDSSKWIYDIQTVSLFWRYFRKMDHVTGRI